MAEKLAILHGDGVSDDTEAMQAFVNGEVVGYADGRPYERDALGRPILQPGVYLCRTVKIHRFSSLFGPSQPLQGK